MCRLGRERDEWQDEKHRWWEQKAAASRDAAAKAAVAAEGMAPAAFLETLRWNAEDFIRTNWRTSLSAVSFVFGMPVARVWSPPIGEWQVQ